MRFGFFTRLVLAAYSAFHPPLTPSLTASSLSVSPALTVTVLPETAGVVFAGLAAGVAAALGAAVVAFLVVVVAFGAVRVVERDVDGAGAAAGAAAAVAAPPLALVRPARGPQTGHAVGPLVARIRWATAICCSRVAWWGSGSTAYRRRRPSSG